MTHREDRRSLPHTPDERHHLSTGKYRLSVGCSRAGEGVIDLVTASVILLVLFLTIWVMKARRRPVRRILRKVSI
ncbi:hypothetical protein BDV26DRAFT_268850 [Aspergillus bertholletiae]|uniref:Uncharacterized protein n=1 Tax=Aspergillus bertholletiae TaxID=1226010 RepID=A0A5N7AYV6_9EURO|nr:hypothetical protein BDV26DRAFT_268850 [Aspergillus bertholletiae]